MSKESQIYYFLRQENQSIVSELLRLVGIKNPKQKIKEILDKQDFEVLEYEKNGEVKKIRKKTTGEIFEKGGKFYCLKYKKWHEVSYFDESLFGTYYGNSFYINYVRGEDGGLYKLEEMSTSETVAEEIKNKVEIQEIMKELALQGLSTSICYDSKLKSLYIDLDTGAKSHLYLYEDGTIRGRYNYENTINLNSDMDEIVLFLCREFSQALHGRGFGNSQWFELCKNNNVKIETYM